MPSIRTSSYKTPAKPTRETPPAEQTKSMSIPSPQDRYNYDAARVNVNRTPISSLAQQTDGYESWILDHYFSQVLAEHDEVKPFMPSLSDINQQYSKIDLFEIKVIDPIVSGFITDEERHGYKGKGRIFSGTIIPRRFDLFVASTSDGVYTVFQLVDIDEMSEYGETLYQIDYVSVATFTKEFEAAILSKVVDNYTYSKDNALSGARPFLNDMQLSMRNSLIEYHSQLIQMFIDDFVTPLDGNILLLPNQSSRIMDHYHTTFISNLINITDYHALRSINWRSTSYKPESNMPTLWDALLRKNNISERGNMSRICNKLYLISKSHYQNRQVYSPLNSIYYLRVDKLITTSIEGDIRPISSLDASVSRNTSLEDLGQIDISHTERMPGSTVKSYPAIHDDDCYVFTENFYKGKIEQMTVLEKMTYDYIDKKEISSSELCSICEQVFDMPSLERFYFTFIIILLIKDRVVNV